MKSSMAILTMTIIISVIIGGVISIVSNGTKEEALKPSNVAAYLLQMQSGELCVWFEDFTNQMKEGSKNDIAKIILANKIKEGVANYRKVKNVVNKKRSY